MMNYADAQNKQTISIQNETNTQDLDFNTEANAVTTPECLRDKYQFLRLLGEGANGKTFLAVSTTTRKLVAIKELKLVDQFKSLELFQREAKTLANLNVEGVPKFYGFVTSEDHLGECYIIQEFFDFPSLQDLIDQNKKTNRNFSEAETYLIMRSLGDILEVLQTQYSPPIIHRDIKPSNILYDAKTQKVMLIDFGAVANPAKKSAGSTVAGTLGFMAPEQLMGECTVQSDYYAMAATALYMMTSISPVDMENDPDNPFLLNSDHYLSQVNVSANMKQFIKDMMCPQIEERPKNATDLQDQLYKLGKHSYQGNLGKRNRITRKRRLDFNTLVWGGLEFFASLCFGTCAGFLSALFLSFNTSLDFIISWPLSSIIMTFLCYFIIAARESNLKEACKRQQGILHMFEIITEDAAKALFKGKIRPTDMVPLQLVKFEEKIQNSATNLPKQIEHKMAEYVYMHNGEYFYYYGTAKVGDLLLFREEQNGELVDELYKVTDFAH